MLKLPAVGLLGYFLPCSWAAGEIRRRALIVGIDKYIASGEKPPKDREFKVGAHASASSKAFTDRHFFDLDGAVNDAKLMNQIIQDRFGFAATDIIFLENEQASRVRILHEFQSHLIDAAAPGDLSLFYYAGHGSQVSNLASDEVDQLDETFVPSNSAAGEPDIRDKEMARLYRAALKKQLELTVILDSCHSGGMSRGGWNGAGKTRRVEPSPISINDPPDRDPASGKKLPDPTSLGMMFLAATSEDQPAVETSIITRDANGTAREVAHGAFTAALGQVLQSSIANQNVEEICTRIQAILASQGSLQVPICAGSGRGSRSLFGPLASMDSSITLAVESVNGPSTVRLRGGSALGLASGCTLIHTRSGTDSHPVRIELTQVDLGLSEARLIGPSAGARVHPGDLFRLETWVVPPPQSLAVFFSNDALSTQSILATARSLDRLAQQGRIQIVPELDQTNPPTHVLYWRGGAYHLEHFPSDGDGVALSAVPEAEEIGHQLSGTSGVRLWSILPTDGQTASSLRLGAGTENSAVRVVDDSAKSIYFLAGRLREGKLEYSWVFKDSLMARSNQVRLPMCTDWTSTPAQITRFAARLARIYGWVNLNGPSGGDPAFPYKLALVKSDTGQPASAGPFKFGERYKFVFEADVTAFKQTLNGGGVAKRYVYVFLMDSFGDANCFFPKPANGNDSNLLPRTDPPESRIVATRDDYDVEISEPAGIDNYFMVASEQPLDPGVFQWTGVRGTETKRGGAGNPLEFLFNIVGEGARGGHAIQSVPATWSIQSFSVRSVP